ncbi:peptide chain release factor 1 [Candidatus Woesearchaeota archaeon]|nr:peptide chain release factor 1 [Candidatus Woesearchaeota archaeon]|tara:strand:+ start:287 stop:1390 length:1104 start_codon:yes stop_codon:yes gene_type:complete
MEAKISAKDRFKLKQFIKELVTFKGRHTELVSVYIPQGYDMNKIMTHLSQEQGTATNIKSKATRDNVISALEKMIQHLKLYPRTPPNGLAVFAGNVAEREGQQDYQVFSYNPVIPIKVRIYRCDKEFVLDPLQEMVEEREIYGMVVFDRRDAQLALLKGKTIMPLSKTHSEVPGKFRAGGQSAARFSRLREGAIKDHYKKVADYMKEEFLHMKDLKGILIGGPSTTTTDFINKDYLTGDLKKKIIAVKDLSYTGDFGLQELLDRSADVLAKEEVAKEKALMQDFFEKLSTKSEFVTYGKDAVMNAIKMGAAETILISEVVEDDIVEQFEEAANKTGSKVEIISTETREGVQLRDMGKIVATLRYPIS